MRFPAAICLSILGLIAIQVCDRQSTAQAADAASLTTLGQTSDDNFITVDKAFQAQVTATTADEVEVTFHVNPCCYLYRERMKFELAAGQPASLGTPDMPAGKPKTDDLGEHHVFHEDVVVRLPVLRSSTAATTVPLKVGYQGCNEPVGICYAPQNKEFEISLPEATAVSAKTGAGSGNSDAYVSEEDWLAGLIRNGNIFLMVGAFFLSGLLLSFTPCVLPMVPIVAGLITAGGAAVTRTRGFALSLAYVLGMAATYTAAGVAVAAAGQQAQTLFQQTWIILLFSALFVAMAISMFGFFTVQMPSFIQTRLTELSNQQKAGSYAGVAVMGALSALIVTTCVGPALVAALSVISQSGQVFRGGVALFSMAIGMGVPLLVVGASAGQLLPRAGAWMDTVKQAVGAMMLAVAVWMLSRVLPERVTMVLWAIPLLALVIIFTRSAVKGSGARAGLRFAGALAGVYAVFLVIGAARGATDPLRPLQVEAPHTELPFVRIKSLDDLNAKLAEARAAGKTVMLDFYADWCVECKVMEKSTFPKDVVRSALANTVWLQADVTANDATDIDLQKQLGVHGPPTIAFFGTDGVERRKFRFSGAMKPAEFAELVGKAFE